MDLSSILIGAIKFFSENEVLHPKKFDIVVKSITRPKNYRRLPEKGKFTKNDNFGRKSSKIAIFGKSTDF